MASELERTIDNIVDDTVNSKLDSFTSDLAERLREECSALVEQVRRLDSQSSAASIEKLLEGLRQIQGGDSVVEAAAALVDAASNFCGRVGLLINKGDHLLGFRLAGAEPKTASAFQELSVNLLEASSFARVVDSVSNTVSSGSAADLSQRFATLMDVSVEDRVGVYPLRLRNQVLAILYCDSKRPGGASAPLQSAAIEALILSAEGWIEAVSTRRR